MKKKILRIGVLNDFGFTDAELKQADWYAQKYDVFVNSNAHNKIKGDYPSIVTVNPDLTKFVEPKGDLSNLKAVRIKWVYGPKHDVDFALFESFNWAAKNKIPVLITLMRFTSKKDLLKYTYKPDSYEWKDGYYKHSTFPFSEQSKQIFFCDEKGKGCPSCRNCAKLTYNRKDKQIYGINLSTSGFCKYNCPSCFAKRIIKLRGLRCDVIYQNRKQKGK